MPLWKPAAPLLLASASAPRRQMLEAAGIPVETQSSGIDERAVEAEAGAAAPEAVAALLAAAKARAVAAIRPGRIVVAADQTLACDGRSFVKPADRAAARRQLQALRGRTHQLHSAVAVHADGAERFATVATAALTMRDFSDRFLDAYLDAAGDKVTQSVGAYQVEGLGIQLFARIEGDHFTILGLPLLALLGHLRAAGWLED